MYEYCYEDLETMEPTKYSIFGDALMLALPVFCTVFAVI